ncbi:ATP-dependent Clp protease adaptor ClpS [Candidatus Gracilibacteria bacterium]|nr:ATP-dependent Clp protease adaptor ClpS [Candidatus Gracilibacteria bacterium]
MQTEAPDVKVIPETTFVVVTEEELEKPYRVIIENDDVTPMEFVVMVLRVFFGLDIDRAMMVMLTAHHEGRALVTTLPYEEAKERVYNAHSAAREVGYPLSFYLEPDVGWRMHACLASYCHACRVCVKPCGV